MCEGEFSHSDMALHRQERNSPQLVSGAEFSGPILNEDLKKLQRLSEY